MNDTKINIEESLIQKLSKNLKGNCDRLGEVEIFTIDEEIGKGSMRYMPLQTGVHVINLQLSLFEDTSITVDNEFTESLQFYYCHKGEVSHHFKGQEIDNQFDQFQTAITHSVVGYDSQLFIPKDTFVDIHITYVDKELFFNNLQKNENYFGTHLLHLLRNIDDSHEYVHLGNLNLKIAAQLRLVSYASSENKLSQSLLNKGRYYIILAKQIDQFYSEKSAVKNTSGLLKKELQEITLLSEAIKEKPEIQYNLKKLCFESGLSPAKLQEGFKFMFDRTVSDFIKTTRLEKAEFLIRTTDLSISEIVYSIGLTSRSYFCKIFKGKYHYSPKEYRKKST